MRKLYSAYVIGLGLVACSSSAPSGSRPEQHHVVARNSDFNVYWTSFRTAALASDTAKLAALAKFPVRSKGELDDETVRSLTPKQFPAEIKSILSRADYSQETMLGRIRKTPMLQPQDIDGGNHQRFGSFGFERFNGRWLLTTIYRDNN